MMEEKGGGGRGGGGVGWGHGEQGWGGGLIRAGGMLTLKAPITSAADDIHKYFFIVFQRK